MYTFPPVSSLYIFSAEKGDYSKTETTYWALMHFSLYFLPLHHLTKKGRDSYSKLLHKFTVKADKKQSSEVEECHSTRSEFYSYSACWVLAELSPLESKSTKWCQDPQYETTGQKSDFSIRWCLECLYISRENFWSKIRHLLAQVQLECCILT